MRDALGSDFVSFTASARRARDASRPLGLRARNLHECLERFNLFGFEATRARLRIQVGAGERWTSPQVVDALALLESARVSWLAFAAAEAERQRALKRAGRRTAGRDERLGHLHWLDAYLVGSPARLWRTTGLGDCTACPHPLTHHGAHGCRACRWTGTPLAEWCTVPIPPADRCWEPE